MRPVRAARTVIPTATAIWPPALSAQKRAEMAGSIISPIDISVPSA